MLDGIEIQRGPAAVRYGGNALNGAINLIDSKVPKSIPEGGLTGATEVRYGTGDAEKTVVGKVTAGIGAFAIHAEGSSRSSDDYEVPDAYGSDRLRHSFAKSSSYSAGASWVTSKGYLGAAYTRQTANYGLPGHSHENAVCHTHSIQLHCSAHGSITNPFDGIDDSLPATVDLRSDRFDVRGDYDRLLPGLDHVRLRLSYTDYQHQELDGGTVFTRYANKVYDGRVELTHQPVLGFTGTFGAQYTNGVFSGIDYIDPEQSIYSRPDRYRTENTGIFLNERQTFGRLTVEMAARKDWRDLRIIREYYQDGQPLTGAELARIKPLDDARYDRQFPASTVNPFSVSFGAELDLSGGYSVGVSLARSQRAPGVRELYARASNLGTNSYEVGLARTDWYPALKLPQQPNVLESAKSIDLNLVKKGGKLEFDLGFFYKDIGDYVYARLIDTEPNHLFLLYTAADVRFLGVDGQISYRLDGRSQVAVFGDYVDARLKSKLDNMPRIPPGRLGVRYALTEGPVSGDVEYSRTFAQNRFASYETQTSGYDNLNATLAYRVDVGGSKSVEFYVRGTNLTNKLAFAHTSFVKNQSPLRGRNVVLGMRHQF